MTVVLTLAGVALLVASLVDVHATTITMRGGGPISSRLVDMLWRPAARGARVTHHVLSWYGSLMVTVVVMTWVALLYGGWSLVFAVHPDAVVNAMTGAPVGIWDRLYFVGYVVTTLGNGELRPGGPPWQLLTVAVALSGLVTITLAITYVVPVLESVVHKRQVARTIVGMGATTSDILANAWDGTGFPALTTHLGNLVPELSALANEHVAYPVLHHFHAADRGTALAPAVAVLDDALTLLRHGVDPKNRPDVITLRMASTAVGDLLAALEAAHIDPVDDPPDPPALDILDHLHIPTVAADEYAAAVADCGPRRALLMAFVASDGWQWGTA